MKRIATIEDQLDEKKYVELKKKKGNGPRTEKLEGFKEIDDDYEVVLFKSNLNTEFLFPNRNPTLIELFFKKYCWKLHIWNFYVLFNHEIQKIIIKNI